MLEGCKQFAKTTLSAQQVSRGKLLDLIQQNADYIRENLERATAYRIDNYHSRATAWRTVLGPEKWASLPVVIPGAPMSRRHNLTTQYFAKLLGKRGEGDRTVYEESIFDEGKVLIRRGTHLFDTQLGEDVFSDRCRMHRDALGAAAAQYLDALSME